MRRSRGSPTEAGAGVVNGEGHAIGAVAVVAVLQRRAIGRSGPPPLAQQRRADRNSEEFSISFAGGHSVEGVARGARSTPSAVR